MTLALQLQSFPPIVRLLFASSPFTIVWFVITVVVNAFKSQMRGWTLSHVSIKVFKGVPTFANLYASTAIVAIACNSGVFTSLFHRVPDVINRIGSHAVFKIMWVLLEKLFLQASATLSTFVFKGLTTNSLIYATIAEAVPVRVAMFGYMRKGLYNKATEAFTYKIEMDRHDIPPVGILKDMCGKTIRCCPCRA